MKLKRIAICILLVGFLLAVSAVAQEKYDVVIENDVRMKTRDGVSLQSDVYRPKADRKFPVILERTPYDKHAGVSMGLNAAARGYVFIMQDCRGRFASEGDWYPHKFEARDGYDAVEWAATLPYANGKVGMMGGSYVSSVQMHTAVAAPPHLVGILPVATASNYHENWVYQGGAFAQSFNQIWTTSLAVDTLGRRVLKDIPSAHGELTLPLTDYPVLIPGSPAGLADYYLDWIAHPHYDDYWKETSIEEHYSQIKVPAMHVGGWYDFFQNGILQNFQGIKAHGGSEAARHGQRLIMIVGGHAGMGRKVGELDFGKDSVVDTTELAFRWYDYLLKGIDNGMGREKPVRIFVMGKNRWREEDTWPPQGAHRTSYYLHSRGKANTLSGNGTLSITPPAAETADEYIYDPADPVPTRGGPIPLVGPRGPVDQRPIENRADVLVYTTPPFPKDTEVTGPLSLELYIKSSAVDTDFTGKLVDVWPNGYAQNLVDGILRARYRHSMEIAEFMNPGEVYKLTIDLWSTSNVFLAGHELRLEVSSSNFPRFDRNLNTGEEPETGKRMVKATNMVYHDREHPSALSVPILP